VVHRDSAELARRRRGARLRESEIERPEVPRRAPEELIASTISIEIGLSVQASPRAA